MIEKADIPGRIPCPHARIPAEAGFSSRNKEGRERPNYEGRSLKSRNRRPKPKDTHKTKETSHLRHKTHFSPLPPSAAPHFILVASGMPVPQTKPSCW